MGTKNAGVSDHDLLFSKMAEDSDVWQGQNKAASVDSRQTAQPPSTFAARHRTSHPTGTIH